MRLHRSERLQNQWYTLPAEIRAFVESLKTNPTPHGSRVVHERPNRYEDFISGAWIVWEIDKSGSETIIRVTISD